MAMEGRGEQRQYGASAPIFLAMFRSRAGAFIGEIYLVHQFVRGFDGTSVLTVYQSY
jgi:hypothetical protein